MNCHLVLALTSALVLQTSGPAVINFPQVNTQPQNCLLVLALASALVFETSALGNCPYCETSYKHCLDLFGCSNRISDSDRCYQYCFYRFEVCERTTNCKPQAPPSLEEFQKATIPENLF